MKITREIITDLWPLYVEGEASAETRVLVEEFLKQDPEFSRLLTAQEARERWKFCVPTLPPDREAQALKRTKRLLRGSNPLYVCALLFSSFAFARILSDTSFDVSPRNFIISATIAAGFWVAYSVRSGCIRREFYRSKAGSNP